MGVLKILGRGLVFDELKIPSNANPETHRVFFHRFIERFSIAWYKKEIQIPVAKEVSELICDVQHFNV
jgi:hypothetical protein